MNTPSLQFASRATGRNNSATLFVIRRGFTLIELLVVIAIISLLVSILLPSLTKARDLAKKTICQTQQRGLHTGFMFYANDFKEIVFDRTFTGTYGSVDTDWSKYLWQYFDLPASQDMANLPSWGGGTSWTRSPQRPIFTCPAAEEPRYDRKNSYVLNLDLYGHIEIIPNVLYGHTLSEENRHGAQCIRMGDVGTDGPSYIHSYMCNYNDPACAQTYLSYIHSSGGNYLFCDGHVEWVLAELGVWQWANSNYCISLYPLAWND